MRSRSKTRQPMTPPAERRDLLHAHELEGYTTCSRLCGNYVLNYLAIQTDGACLDCFMAGVPNILEDIALMARSMPANAKYLLNKTALTAHKRPYLRAWEFVTQRLTDTYPEMAYWFMLEWCHEHNVAPPIGPTNRTKGILRRDNLLKLAATYANQVLYPVPDGGSDGAVQAKEG